MFIFLRNSVDKRSMIPRLMLFKCTKLHTRWEDSLNEKHSHLKLVEVKSAFIVIQLYMYIVSNLS